MPHGTMREGLDGRVERPKVLLKACRVMHATTYCPPSPISGVLSGVQTLVPTGIKILQVLSFREESPLLLEACRHRLWSCGKSLVWPVHGVESAPDLDLSNPVLVRNFRATNRVVLVLAEDGIFETREVACAEERLQFRSTLSAPPALLTPPGLTMWEYGHNEDGTESYVALCGHHVTNKDTDGRPYVFHMTFLAPSFEEARDIIDKIKY